MRWRYRLAIFVVVSLLLCVVCVNATTAGAPEDVAEMIHGSISTVLYLWLIGALKMPSDSGSDRNGGDALAAPCAASQSGAENTAHRPNNTAQPPKGDR